MGNRDKRAMLPKTTGCYHTQITNNNHIPLQLAVICSLFLVISSCDNPFIQRIVEPKTVTFESNGGSGVERQTVFKDQPVRRPTDPSRSGFTFDAWYSDDETFLEEWDFAAIPTGDITLYAKWNTIPPEQLPYNERWSNGGADDSTATLEYSVDDDGVFTIIVGGTPEPNIEGNYSRWKANVQYAYTAEANASYIYEFEAWTKSGNRSLNIQYYWDDDTGIFILQPEFTITGERNTYRIYGEQIPKGGIRQVQFQCADQLGTFYVKMISITKYDGVAVPPEQLPASQRWSKFVADDSSAILNYSVDNENVCTITVGGSPSTIRWKASAQYSYTAETSASYIYEFEAWTESGNRELSIQYYNDWAGDGTILSEYGFYINSSRRTYTITGEQIPEGGIRQVEFQCADQTGKFYVKMISITKHGD